MKRKFVRFVIILYTWIIHYMLDSALNGFPIERSHSVSVLVKNIDDSPPDLIIEERQSD